MAKRPTWPLTKVVEIHWADANARSRWGSREEYLEHDIAPILSTGYVLKESKKSITIIQSQGANDDDCNGAISIPRDWCVKVKVLRK